MKPLDNKNIWTVEDFVKNIYIRKGVDNLNFKEIKD